MFSTKRQKSQMRELFMHSVNNPARKDVQVLHDTSDISSRIDSTYNPERSERYMEMQEQLKKAVAHSRKYRTKLVFSDFESQERCTFWHKGTFNMVAGMSISVNRHIVEPKHRHFVVDFSESRALSSSMNWVVHSKPGFLSVNNGDGVVLVLPVCESEEDYFQYQLLYPHLTLPHSDIIELCSTLEYCTLKSHSLLRLRRVKTLIFFSKIMSLLPMAMYIVLSDYIKERIADSKQSKK